MRLQATHVFWVQKYERSGYRSQQKKWQIWNVPSIFGNPFVVGKGYKQGEAAFAYLEYMNNRIANDPKYAIAINQLVDRVREGENIALVCWCSPKPCHAEHIKKYIDKVLAGE